MARKTLKKAFLKFRYYLQWVPFTAHTFLYGLAVFLCYKLLYTSPPEAEAPDTHSFRMLISLMGKVAFWFVISLVLLSVLSALAAWLYYLWLKKSRSMHLETGFKTERSGRSPGLWLETYLPGAFRPLLGFVRGRLVYDDLKLTDTFTLLSSKRKPGSIKREAISGKSRLLLPDIRTYRLIGGFVYFEDMLRLFSFAVRQPVQGTFYQPPGVAGTAGGEVFPKKTESLDVRIEQMRRVDGEYLNYKDFEAGDDVRRIVWKVYARSRELVVRVPELFEPYASHLYFYASFSSSVSNSWGGSGYLDEMLNYYKNRVWTVYETLSRKEWELRYIPDQQLVLPGNTDLAEKTARIISSSNWQQELPASRYFNTRQGAVLCISSLNDPADLSILLEQCDKRTVIYYAKLSQTFRHFVAWGWLKRLLFMPPKDRLSRLRSSWIFSPLRARILKNEKAIERLLENADAASSRI